MLAKIHCTACGSTKLEIRGQYYACQHCKTQFMRHSKSYIRWYLVLLSLFLALGYFYIEQSKEEINEHISTQIKKVERVEPLTDMESPEATKPWDKMYPKDTVYSIGDIQKTHTRSYLLSGVNRSQNTWFAEIDTKGHTIWEKEYPNNINGKSKVLALKEGYILSQKRASDGKTFYLNKMRQTLYTFSYYFSAMQEVSEGFIGIYRNSIMRINSQGDIVWKKKLDTDKRIQHSGMKINSNEIIHYKKTFDSLKLDTLVKLKDGDFVAMGSSNRTTLVLIKLNSSGEIIWKKLFNQSKVYSIEDAVATKDGGFILNAGTGISILKFSKDGALEFNTQIHQYRFSYARTIIETEEGYISMNQIQEGANILVLKLDLEGNIIEDHIYKSTKRLHANHIVKAFDGGYLLSISTEIYNAWLIKTDKDAKITVDFSKQVSTNTQTKKKLNTKAKIEILQERFEYLGGNLKKIIPSKDGNFLYTLTGATGFKIFDISDMSEVKEVGNFRKSKLKLRVTANRISPIGRKYEGEGEYAYDSPFQCVISKNERKAYIIDIKHGFYILDISDKSKPKLLAEVPRLKGSTFALSKDEKTVYIAQHDTLKQVDISNYKAIKFKTFPFKSKWENGIVGIVLSPSEEILYTTNVDRLVMYHIKEQRIIERIVTSGMIYALNLSSDKNTLYLSNRLGFQAYDIGSSQGMKEKFEVTYKNRVKSFIVSNDEKTIYLSSDNGTKVLNIEDTLNPKIETIYTNPARSYVSVTGASVDKKTLYVGFSGYGMARVKL